ncbi:hypothetical protein ACE38V_06185 [Cytobacillus sp. Hz8]|uniref:hypothetical protein n=1 Tax=Cytobacillus sp. Hz8 TaxID=3347168 RepID=UPI0035E374A8
MNTLTKGALAMVLAGSVTFSVTNALLGGQPFKRLAEENPLTISRDLKKMDIDSQAEKWLQNQRQTTNKKDDQTKLSQDNHTLQLAYRNKSDSASAATQQNTKKIIKNTTTNVASAKKAATITSVGKAKNETNTKAPMTKPTSSTETKTTTPPSRTSETNTSGTTTTTTNHGQQVSQAAKENAANRDKTENNGKKM